MAQESLIEYVQHVVGAGSTDWVLEHISTRVKVAHFDDRPVSQACTWITIGISRYLLYLGGGEETRQELVFCAHRKFEAERLITFLLVFSEVLIKKHNALRRGQVIFPPERLMPESQMEAVYITSPSRLGECFASFEEFTRGIEFVGLVPLYASEVDYVRKFGKKRFEKLLDSERDSFLNLLRDPWI